MQYGLYTDSAFQQISIVKESRSRCTDHIERDGGTKGEIVNYKTFENTSCNRIRYTVTKN